MFIKQINENITLRHPQLDDAPALFDLFESNRAHLTEWQDSPNKIQSLDDTRAYIQRHNRAYDAGRGLACLIIFKGDPVGMVYLDKIVSVVRKAEIGYWIAKNHEGQGIVTQSTRGLLAHAFEVLKLNRIALKFKHVSHTHENYRSRRIAERLGFTEEGILRQDGMTKGVFMDMVMYSLLAEEWHTMHNNA